MPTERTPLLDGMVRVLELDCFRDERGSLVPVTFDDLGFRVARTFVVTAPRGAVRGGHAHRTVRQVLLRATGSVELEVRRDGVRSRLTLDEACPAVLIEPGVWARQTYLHDGSTLVVFADGPYDADEYDAAESGDAELGDAESGDAESGDAESRDAEPGVAESAGDESAATAS